MSPRQALPRSLTWDLFCPLQARDDLRSITLLATQLANAPNHRVRVFINDPGRLVPLSARIEGGLWWQPMANCDLVRLRLAEAVAPADHVVCPAGLEPPTRYRERMAYGAGGCGKLFRLWPLGHATPPDPAHRAATTSLLRIDVVQDTKASGSGIVKDARGLADLRLRWKTHPSLVQTTLEQLGVPADWSQDALIVSQWGAAIADAPGFAAALARASDRRVVLLPMDDPEEPPDRSAPPRAAITATPANAMPLRIQPLPKLAWNQLDELIWSSDLLFCGRRDVALRAMESGTPVLWLPDHPAPDDGLDDWYYEDLDPGSRRRLAAVAHSLRENSSQQEALNWYLRQREDLEQIARQVARRIAEAPNLADVLPTLSPTMAAQARRRKQHDNAHPPTWPMSLPGRAESA